MICISTLASIQSCFSWAFGRRRNLRERGRRLRRAHARAVAFSHRSSRSEPALADLLDLCGGLSPGPRRWAGRAAACAPNAERMRTRRAEARAWQSRRDAGAEWTAQIVEQPAGVARLRNLAGPATDRDAPRPLAGNAEHGLERLQGAGAIAAPPRELAERRPRATCAGPAHSVAARAKRRLHDASCSADLLLGRSKKQLAVMLQFCVAHERNERRHIWPHARRSSSDHEPTRAAASSGSPGA